MTETREHRVEKRAAERYALNGTAAGWSLFTVAHLCSQNNSMGGIERRKKGGERGTVRRDGRPKVGSTSQQHNRVVREG